MTKATLSGVQPEHPGVPRCHGIFGSNGAQLFSPKYQKLVDEKTIGGDPPDCRRLHLPPSPVGASTER